MELDSDNINIKPNINLYNKINNNEQFIDINNSKTTQINLQELSLNELENKTCNELEYDECCESSTCCKKLVEFELDSLIIINMLPICEFRKQILKRRYTNDITDYQKKRDCIRFAFRFFQMIVTVGSILVPSLLSIQMTDHVKDNYEIEINISVWCLSVFVSICNGVINLFKMEELYYSYAITYEKLKTLWYQYISLSGPFINTTHNISFNNFIILMEEIIMNQKFQEFIDSKSNKNKPKHEHDKFENEIKINTEDSTKSSLDNSNNKIDLNVKKL